MHRVTSLTKDQVIGLDLDGLQATSLKVLVDDTQRTVRVFGHKDVFDRFVRE